MTPPGPREGRLKSANRVILAAGGLVIFFCSLLVAVDVLLRSIFSESWLYSFELSCYAFAVAVAFSLGDGVLERTHIRIDVFYRRLPLVPRCIADVLAGTLLALLAAGLAAYACEVAIGSWEIGSRANTSLGTPLVVPQGLWALGLVMFAIICVITALRAWAHLVRRRWSDVERVAGMPEHKASLD